MVIVGCEGPANDRPDTQNIEIPAGYEIAVDVVGLPICHHIDMADVIGEQARKGMAPIAQGFERGI